MHPCKAMTWFLQVLIRCKFLVQVVQDIFEELPVDVVLKIFGSLTLRELVRLTCVCKTWSTAALKHWTSVEIDDGYVTPFQAPLVLAFLNKLGLHSQHSLQRMVFPMQMPGMSFLPGACLSKAFFAKNNYWSASGPTLLRVCHDGPERFANICYRICSATKAQVDRSGCALRDAWVWPQADCWRLHWTAGVLHYQRFKSLQSLDFGINPEYDEDMWMLRPSEVKQLSGLKNLKRLVSWLATGIRHWRHVRTPICIDHKQAHIRWPPSCGISTMSYMHECSLIQREALWLSWQPSFQYVVKLALYDQASRQYSIDSEQLVSILLDLMLVEKRQTFSISC